jgi:hypothetical protein
LFPDDADSAKTYLAVMQTSLNNLEYEYLGEYGYLSEIVFPVQDRLKNVDYRRI